MKIGLFLFTTDLTSDIRDVARAAEDAGFESLFTGEHAHIPVERDTPYRLGGDLPEHYVRLYDPFIALTAAGCVTEKIKLGTAICVIPEHDPISLAKKVSTVDVVTNGRFLFGVGTGWNREELADHGIVFADRFEITRDRLGMMQALWTQDEAVYDSPHATLRPSWQWPKPAQSPMPILVGGDGPKSMHIAIGCGGDWFPMATEDKLEDRMAKMQGFAEEAGARTPATTLLVRTTEDPDLDALRSIGVDRTVFMLPPRGDAVAAVREFAAKFGVKPD
jgi:probable F420-dependent oxidoreductase